MATQELREIESKLESIYRQEIVLYAGLLKEMEALPVNDLAGDQAEIALRQMAGTMSQVAELDQSSLSLRDRWKRLGGTAHGSLGQALRDTEQLIVQVTQRIQQAEHAAVAMKQRLIPRISTETRRRQMAHAYDAAKRQG
jgi:hypothetical protein